MFLALIVILVGGPIVELALLITVGKAIGVWPVIGLCLATAGLGGVLIRRQGLAAIRSAERDIASGSVPVEAAVDGAFLALAAPLLMTPGFLSDALGFLLLVPAFRHFLARRALAALRRRVAGAELRLTRF
jgi:UPF0716 protein FxsA